LAEDEAKPVQKTVYSFESIDDEMTFVFDKIGSLAESGVSLNKIFFLNPSSDYLKSLKKFSEYYNFPFEDNSRYQLYESPIYKKFISLLDDQELEEAFSVLLEQNKNDTYHVLEKLTSAINSIIELKLNKTDFVSLLNYVAKNTTLSQMRFEESVKIVDESFRPQEDDYVFILGFAQSSYPPISQDTDFFSDIEKRQLGKNDSKTKTKIARNSLISFIYHTKQLIITRSEHKGVAKIIPSSLIKELQMKEEKGRLSLIRYSSCWLDIQVALAKDILTEYGIDSPLTQAIDDEKLKFRKYSHAFKPLDNYFSDDLVLSYSQINEYFSCPFSYFAKRLLKDGSFDDTFFSNLGSLAHKILEESVDKEVSLENYQTIFNELFTTAKEKFFANNLFPQVMQVMKVNLAFRNDTSFTNMQTEKVINIQLDEHTRLNGKIDKLMLNDSLKQLVIVDYKTGSADLTDFEFANSHGLKLQLPLYSLFAAAVYPDYKLVGLFIQTLLFNQKDILENQQKEEKSGKEINLYTLSGPLLYDLDVIKSLDFSILDSCYENRIANKSWYLTGISVNKDGTLKKKNNTADESTFIRMKEIALAKAKEASTNIRKGQFDIRPVAIQSINRGEFICNRCPCKDVCFVKYGDGIYYSKDASDKPVSDDETEEE